MIEILFATTLSGVAAVAVILATVKVSTPMTTKEAKVLWALHTKTYRCESHKWEPIMHNRNKIVGFRCACGYKYTQTRPLICGSVRGLDYSKRLAPHPL